MLTNLHLTVLDQKMDRLLIRNGQVETGAQSTGVQHVPEAYLWLRPHCLRVAWGQVRTENQAGGCHPEEYYVSPEAVS